MSAHGDAVRALAARYDPGVLGGEDLRARVRLAERDGEAADVVLADGAARVEAAGEAEPDALVAADAAAWAQAAHAPLGVIDALRARRLSLRRDLHLAIGLLAATAGDARPERLALRAVETPLGTISTAQAGSGPPLLALHGLGGSKASFLPTLLALADARRVVAIDLPGFGDSVKPAGVPYDAPFFARAVADVLDALGLPRADLLGNSMGGRIALEVALEEPARVGAVALLSPAMAWLRPRPWTSLVRALPVDLPLPALVPPRAIEALVRGLVPGGEDGWAAAGIDEFARAYATPGGRSAFHAAARAIYLDEPHGETGLWSRLRAMETPALFVWGREDKLVPIAFMRHVEAALPAARHVELPCGHVPQVELPGETHAAIRAFLADCDAASATARA
jgi:pimeloyl-ACP methyl ester carboxylesterase